MTVAPASAGQSRLDAALPGARPDRFQHRIYEGCWRCCAARVISRLGSVDNSAAASRARSVVPYAWCATETLPDFARSWTQPRLVELANHVLRSLARKIEEDLFGYVHGRTLAFSFSVASSALTRAAGFACRALPQPARLRAVAGGNAGAHATGGALRGPYRSLFALTDNARLWANAVRTNETGAIFAMARGAIG